jgi:hypothetical protein
MTIERPSRKPPAKPRYDHSPSIAWFPMYEEVMTGDFADDNTPDSLTLFMALRFKADICGVVNVIIDEDQDLYSKWMNEARAQAAFDLLVKKGYLIHDARRSQVFIRSYLKWDRITFKTGNNFKALSRHALQLNSKLIRRELGLALARREHTISSPPTIEPLLQELVRELLGPEADAILRHSSQPSASEWTTVPER